MKPLHGYPLCCKQYDTYMQGVCSVYIYVLVLPSIVKREPSFIVMEDLNVTGMMKNKHLAKAVQEQKLAEFYRIMQYKCDWNGIRFITADRFYASSKLCSVCGHKKSDLKLSDRIYRCENCGTVIDRDFNASINLCHYGKSMINH